VGIGGDLCRTNIGQSPDDEKEYKYVEEGAKGSADSHICHLQDGFSCISVYTHEHMPIHLKAELRAGNYNIRKFHPQEQYDTRLRTGGTISLLTERTGRIEQLMEDKWREEWNYYREDNWTRRLIDNSCIFKNNRRNIYHYTMQISSEHSIFNESRKMI
jgi:hypothetical protein